MKLKILIIIAMVGLVSLTLPQSSALSCAIPPFMESYDRHDLLLHGKLVEKELLFPESENLKTTTLTFDTIKVYKGDFSKTITVTANLSWDDYYREGQEYVLFADKDGDDYLRELCVGDYVSSPSIIKFLDEFLLDPSIGDDILSLYDVVRGFEADELDIRINQYSSLNREPLVPEPDDAKIPNGNPACGKGATYSEGICIVDQPNDESNGSNGKWGTGLEHPVSPLKQFKSGIAINEIQCRESLILVIKYDGSPACVKPLTAEKLIQRGWEIIPDNGNSKTSVPVNFDTIDFSKTINANNKFAFDYYTQVNENQNIFFSPWSITSAFAIVNEGAKGNTADEIQNVFGLDENSKENFKAINKILNQENPGYIIEVANSLWLAQDFTLHTDYVDTVQTYYDGTIEKVDFADDGTDVINGWVSDKTRQKIPKLFDPPLLPNTRLVIANAIYFNGTWSMPFDEKNTRDDKFIVSPGEDVTVPFMNKDSFYNHTMTDELQIIELPYEGNGASMLILLPERIDGMESLEEQLTAENLEKWRSEMTKSRLFLQIPKFTLETEYNLVKDLMSLGIKDAFGPADFTGISSESLFIDRAVHKAFVDVNEKGTEAAAATGVGMFQSMPPTFRADHPFVFFIQDDETGNILFMGKVVDPTQ